MNKTRLLSFVILLASLSLATLACGLGGGSSVEPKAPVAPLTIGNDLGQIDLCQAIPVEDIEAVMGRKLASEPERFEYYDTSGSSGCAYDAGKDSSGNAYFGYVALTPASAYDEQPLYQNTDVDGIGNAAYFKNGADARQLWVKIGDKVAFVVAFGDRPNEEGARAIARLVAAAIR